MSKSSVVTVNGVTFAENFDFDTGESVYVADRPFIYRNSYVEVLEFDKFWSWAICQKDTSFNNSNVLKGSAS